MASEISSSASLTVSKNGITLSQAASKVIDMSGDDMLCNTQAIGTSAELVSFGEITGAPSVLFVKNLDSTNYVELGGDSGLTVFKLKLPAGHVAMFQPSSATLYAKANTAAVNLLVFATEA
jgi:hypothetical protein